MYFCNEDLKLCADQFTYSTDNPLGGKRYTYKRTSQHQEYSQDNNVRHNPIKNSTYLCYDITEYVAEIGASLPSASVLSISCLTLNNTLIYLLGTDHVNPKCQIEVSQIISLVKPNKVVVELCKLRACRCVTHMNSIFQNPAHFTFSYLKKVISEIGFVPAFLFMADVYNEMKVSGNVNLEFGGEMSRAIRQARTVHNCELLLGDRPIAVTIQRRTSAMNWWTKLRLIVQVSFGLACKPLRSFLLSNAHRIAELDTMTHYIFVFERDLCLVNALQIAATSHDTHRNLKIVAVVGGGHIKGIHKYWGKMIPEIVRVIYAPKFDFNFR